MRISFDLDDTLICDRTLVKCERDRVPWVLKLWLNEPLRSGTITLVTELQRCGHEIWIYTSSDRQPYSVKLWLRCYGIRVVNVVNCRIHDRVNCLQTLQTRASKNPNLFAIDLHVDDSLGVKMEGDRYGFKVLVIEPTDRSWVDKVLQAVEHFDRSTHFS
jgi:hypothetical protein